MFSKSFMKLNCYVHISFNKDFNLFFHLIPIKNSLIDDLIRMFCHKNKHNPLGAIIKIVNSSVFCVVKRN